MKGIYYLILTILLFVISSCTSESQLEDNNNIQVIEVGNRPTNPIDYLKLPELTEQVYLFSPMINKSNCQTNGAPCDCCTNDLLFIDSTKFIKIDNCGSDKQIYKGTYKAENDKILLKYNPDFYDLEYISHADNETDTTKNIQSVNREFLIVKMNKKLAIDTLSSFQCNDIACFKIYKEEKLYGAVNPQTTLRNEIENFEKLGIWDKLR